MNPTLELGPILRSMRHHKGAFSLLVLEVALGFVMLTHTMIAVRYYFRLHEQAIGLSEDDLIVARRRFVHPRDPEAARAAARADLNALAPIAPAAAVDAEPLPSAAAFPSFLSGPGGSREIAGWPLRATPNVAAALGLTILAGTGLDAAGATAGSDEATPVLLACTAAERLYGTADDAVGRPLFGTTFGRARVVGVVRDFAYRSRWIPDPTSIVVIRAEPVSEHELIYVMRAPAERRAGVVAAAAAALGAIPDVDSAVVVSGFDRRTTRFANLSSGAMIILSWTGFLVVAVALAGALALASFSVAERTRQIGVRRALGAGRGEIVRYFLLENFVLTAFGLGLGLGLALGLNQVLRRIMADMRLTPDEVLLSMAVFLATGLLSALVPARRAALIPPWAATRTL
jgi:putative ABC transport system permease protein